MNNLAQLFTAERGQKFETPQKTKIRSGTLPAGITAKMDAFARHVAEGLSLADAYRDTYIRSGSLPGPDDILAALPEGMTFEPLMTLYLTEGTDPDDVAAAHAAFPDFAATTREQRATLLDAIADEIEARAEAITAIGSQETGLPEARLQGERGRTTGQLRLFA